MVSLSRLIVAEVVAAVRRVPSCCTERGVNGSRVSCRKP